jgi:hypothetical protein
MMEPFPPTAPLLSFLDALHSGQIISLTSSASMLATLRPASRLGCPFRVAAHDQLAGAVLPRPARFGQIYRYIAGCGPASGPSRPAENLMSFRSAERIPSLIEGALIFPQQIVQLAILPNYVSKSGRRFGHPYGSHIFRVSVVPKDGLGSRQI